MSDLAWCWGWVSNERHDLDVRSSITYNITYAMPRRYADDNDDDITLWLERSLSFWLKIWFAFGFFISLRHTHSLCGRHDDRRCGVVFLTAHSSSHIAEDTRFTYLLTILVTCFCMSDAVMVWKCTNAAAVCIMKCGTRGLIGSCGGMVEKNNIDLNLWLCVVCVWCVFLLRYDVLWVPLVNKVICNKKYVCGENNWVLTGLDDRLDPMPESGIRWTVCWLKLMISGWVKCLMGTI